MLTRLTETTGRVIAIGDVHGCLAALDAVLEMVAPVEGDVLVCLGDAVDRGPDSRGVIARLLELHRAGLLVPILGNHDLMLLEYLNLSGRAKEEGAGNEWLFHGGAETLQSYGGNGEYVDEAHTDFIRTWGDCVVAERHFFVHANYYESVPLKHQPWDHLRWESLMARVPGPHTSGKTAVVGHTAHKRGAVMNLGHLVCIDTWCVGEGWLTALEPETGRLWQAREDGQARTGELPPVHIGPYTRG